MESRNTLLKLVADGLTTPDAIDTELVEITVDDDSYDLIRYSFNPTTGVVEYEYPRAFDYGEVDEAFYAYIVERIINEKQI